MADSMHDDGHEETWVTAWCRAVRATPGAVVLAELESTRFLEATPRAAALLGTTPEEMRGLDYLSLAEDPVSAKQAFRMAKDGQIDSFRSRRRLRRADGSLVELVSWGWAIRSGTGPDLGLWVADDEPGSIDVLAPEPADRIGHPSVPRTGATGTLDERWNIAQLSTQPDELLGWQTAALLGTPLHELVLPADRATLLAAFARATTRRDATAHVRLQRRDGRWTFVQATFALSALAGAPVFSFTLDGVNDAGDDRHRGRIDQLERSLRRIGTEVRAAGVLRELTDSNDGLAIGAMARLSARQWEVISHLLRGERVPTIARQMYVSESTVRNHLVAIFRKFNVHSQQELIDVLRRAQTEAPLGAD